MSSMPRIERVGDSSRLIVDGQAYLAIGGELHNSSSSDAAYMADVWPRLQGSGINTVIAAVGWDQVEPEEGRFDFSVVDWLLEGARAADLRLVLLWFGAFKNARSTYAPSWVRSDRRRFPRAVPGDQRVAEPFIHEGATPQPVLSVFSAQLRAADEAAYRAFLTSLREKDPQHTVILVQVENEVGLLGSSRDVSDDALAAWDAPVPAALREAVQEAPDRFPADVRTALKRIPDGGTWSGVFGDGDLVADEVFMAWGFARYCEALAASGKQVLPLPAYANAWIGPQAPGDPPGRYPSGGPTARMLEVWRLAAPSLDFLAPDIYVPDSQAVMTEYATGGNPLFIPEARFRAGDVFAAIARFRGFGYSVFGLEDGRPGSQYSTAAAALLALTPEIVDAQRDGRIVGFALEGQETASATFGGITVTVRNGPALFAEMLLDAGVTLPPPPERLPETSDGSPADGRAFGLILHTDPDSFLVVGHAAAFDFSAEDADVEIDGVRELRLEDGRWQEGRILNGDELLRILPADRIGAARISLLRSPR